MEWLFALAFWLFCGFFVYTLGYIAYGFNWIGRGFALTFMFLGLAGYLAAGGSHALFGIMLVGPFFLPFILIPLKGKVSLSPINWIKGLFSLIGTGGKGLVYVLTAPFRLVYFIIAAPFKAIGRGLNSRHGYAPESTIIMICEGRLKMQALDRLERLVEPAGRIACRVI